MIYTEELDELLSPSEIYDGHRNYYAIKVKKMAQPGGDGFHLRLYTYREDDRLLIRVGECRVDNEAKLRRLITVHGNIPHAQRLEQIAQLDALPLDEWMDDVFLPFLRSDKLVIKKKKGELTIGFYPEKKKSSYYVKVHFDKTREEPFLFEQIGQLRTQPFRMDFFFQRDSSESIPRICGRVHFPYQTSGAELSTTDGLATWLTARNQLQQVWRGDVPFGWSFAVEESGTFLFRDFQFRNAAHPLFLNQYSAATTDVHLVVESEDGVVEQQLSANGTATLCVTLQKGSVVRLGPCMRQTKYRHRDLGTDICFPSQEFTDDLAKLCEDLYSLDAYEIRGLCAVSIERSTCLGFVL